MKNKTIMFLVENYFPRKSGVPIVAQYLAEGLYKKGYEVSVCTKLYDGLQRNEIINGIKVFRFYLRKTALKRYDGEIDTYRNFILSYNADVIIFECSECVTTDVLLKDLSKIKAKKIFHSHGFSGLTLHFFKWNVNLKYTIGNTYNWLRFKYYYNFTFKKYVKYFDATLCLSEIDSSKAWLDKYAKNVTVLQNAVDDIFCNPTRNVSYYPISEIKKPYFLSVATYSKQKNQIGIVREYFKSGVNLPIIFVGPEHTEYLDKLGEEIKLLKSKYGDRDVFTLLKVPRSIIPDIVGNAFVYLVGSTFEEYSISIIEAMTKGIPFISTNVGNARILPGGITIQHIEDMHNKMKELTDNKELYLKLSAAGKNFSEKNCRRSNAVELLEKVITNC